MTANPRELKILPKGIAAQDCSQSVMDHLPMIIRFIRSQFEPNRSEVSIAQVRVLSYLNISQDASLSDVARYLGVTKATASTMITRLVERKLVGRLENPDERRCVRLNLTEDGRRQYLLARKKSEACVAAALESMPAADRQKVKEGIELLSEALTGVKHAN